MHWYEHASFVMNMFVWCLVLSMDVYMILGLPWLSCCLIYDMIGFSRWMVGLYMSGLVSYALWMDIYVFWDDDAMLYA